MKRRKFFFLAGTGVAGLSLASCQGNQTGGSKSGSEASGGITSRDEPSYRKSIKPSFSNGNTKSPNDRIVVALIGAGAFGSQLILRASETGENFIVKYICDVDDTRGGHSMIQLEKWQGFKPKRVRDMRVVFDDKEVDAVFIATPEHWHALATIWACQAGKDVYVEKCISHNIPEGQKMIEAAMKYERVVQCGTHNRSATEALAARDYIESGELGDIATVHIVGLLPGPIPFNEKENSKTPDTLDWDMWLGPAPLVPYNISRHKSWYYYWEYGGGYACTNSMIHQLDLARLILGNPDFPTSVYCAGGRYCFDDNRAVPDYQMATLDFGKYIMTIEAAESTPYMEKSGDDVRFGNVFPRWNQNSTRVEILGTKRMMYVGRMGGGWQVFEKGGKVAAEQPAMYPLNSHLLNFFDCLRTRKQPNGNIVEGHKSSVLAHLANISYRAGNKKLLFSPEYEAILNDDVAQEIIQSGYREGFEIPQKI